MDSLGEHGLRLPGCNLKSLEPQSKTAKEGRRRVSSCVIGG